MVWQTDVYKKCLLPKEREIMFHCHDSGTRGPKSFSVLVAHLAFVQVEIHHKVKVLGLRCCLIGPIPSFLSLFLKVLISAKSKP